MKKDLRATAAIGMALAGIALVYTSLTAAANSAAAAGLVRAESRPAHQQPIHETIAPGFKPSGGHASTTTDASAEEHYVLSDTWHLPVVSATIMSPVGLALDDEGFLYVADRGAGEVRVLNEAGAVVDAWTTPASSEPANCRFAPLDVLFDQPVKAPANRAPSIYITWEPLVAGCRSLLQQRQPHGAVHSVNSVFVGQSSVPEHLLVDPLTGKRVEYAWSGEEDPVMVANLQAAVLKVRSSPPERTVRLISLANGSTIRTIDFGAGEMPLAITSDPVRQRFAVLTVDRDPDASHGAHPRIVEFDIRGDQVGALELRTLGIGPLAANPDGELIPWDWRIAADAGGNWAVTHSAPDITLQRIWPNQARRMAIETASRAGGQGTPDYMLPATWGASTEVAAGPGPGAVVLDRPHRRVVRFRPDGVTTSAYNLPSGDHHELVVTGQDEVEVAYRPRPAGRRTGSRTTSDGWHWLRLSLATGIITEVTPSSVVLSLLGRHGDRSQRAASHGADRFIARPTGCAIARTDALRTRLDNFILCPFPDARVWPDDVAALPDGAVAALDALSRTITIWSSDGSLQHTLLVASTGVGYAVEAGASAAGARRVVVAGSDTHMEVYDPDTDRLIDRFKPLLNTRDGLTPISFDMNAAGQIFVAARDAPTIFVYGATNIRPAPTPEPTAMPSGPQDCIVDGTKVAAPVDVVLGQSTSLRLGVQIVCPDAQRPIGADIVLLVDRSASVVSVAPYLTATLRSLLAELHWSTDRVSVIDFDVDAIVRLIEASTADEVLRVMHTAILDVGIPSTRISKALIEADAHLSAYGRPDAVPVVIILSDGALADLATDAIPHADRLRARGAMLLAVQVIDGGSLWRLPQWTAVTGRADRVWIQPTGADILSIAATIRRAVYGSIAGDVAIEDALGDTMSLVADSAAPPAVVDAAERTLYWHRAVLPADGITFTYRVQPQQPGRWPTNRRAVARYHDAEGNERSFTFPVPFVNVITPTPSPTPVPEPTPSGARLFLPVALSESCQPALAPVDLVLVVDTSASMGTVEPSGRSRLQSAHDAMVGLLNQLDLPSNGPLGAHRVALVGFDTEATLHQPLTADRRALDTALAGLTLGSGTRLDRAMVAAHDEAFGRRHRANAGAVVVLLSDGEVDSAVAAAALVAGDTAKRDGVTVFTIALGATSDAATLRDLASAGAFFRAASGDDLAAIYRRIADLAPCPTSTYWGRR